MSVEGLPKYEDYVPRTYNEQELTRDEFLHPSDTEYPDIKSYEERMKSKKFEVFHDGTIENLGSQEEYDETINKLEAEGYEIKQSVSAGMKALQRTLMSKDKEYRFAKE